MTKTGPSPCTVELVSGPTAAGRTTDFELLFARRALARLKALLGRGAILALLSADIEDGNAFLRRTAEMSNGAFRPATTTLSVRGGMTAAQFLHWLDNAFTNEAELLAAEPEHYVMAVNPDEGVTIVENLGPYVCLFQLPAYAKAPDRTTETENELLLETDYPIRRIAAMTLADGTVVGRMLTQFGDTDEGFNASLTVYFPTACPEEVFEQHRGHLAVEFTNWILAAAQAHQPAER